MLPAKVVVVGTGLAGQAAAIIAAERGAQVTLLEKTNRLGGNSAKATSGINAWGTRTQTAQKVEDGPAFFEQDTFKSGKGGTTDPHLVQMLSHQSATVIHWLGDTFGIPLTVLSQLGGHSRKRTHRAPDQADGTPVPIGYTIMQHLEKYIRTNLSRQVTILTETSVQQLLSAPTEDGYRVRGVVYQAGGQEKTLEADAVVLATGGFSNDHTNASLLTEYAPHLKSYPTTNGPFATGDGVKMARKIGAMLVDMDKVQLHPTGLINPKDPASKTKFLGPEALRGSGGILLNKQGERFVNELDLRSVVSAAIIEQGDVYPESNGARFAYCVLNTKAIELFGVNSHAFYWKKFGLFQHVETLKELAKTLGAPIDVLRGTLETYGNLSSTAERGTAVVCPKTGKNVFPCVIGAEGPFSVALVTPSIHYTMGGCLISPAAELVNKAKVTEANSRMGSLFWEDQRYIEGLFGAGEVTGGVHGRNRLGGNSLLECVVFGRIAGDRAGTILQQRPTAFTVPETTEDHGSLSSLVLTVRAVDFPQTPGAIAAMLQFNLPGSRQTSGLHVGDFIRLEGTTGAWPVVSSPSTRSYLSVAVPEGDVAALATKLEPGMPVEVTRVPSTVRLIPPSSKNGTPVLALWLGGAKPFKEIPMSATHMLLLARGQYVVSLAPLLREAARWRQEDQFKGKVQLLFNAPTAEEADAYRHDLEETQKRMEGQFAYEVVAGSSWNELSAAVKRLMKKSHEAALGDNAPLVAILAGSSGWAAKVRESLPQEQVLEAVTIWGELPASV